MNYEKANEINFNEEFLVKESYPEIIVQNLPQDILMMLKRIYAGRKGEFTSMSQYIYQHFILWSEPKLDNVAHIMEEIAIKEMKHYEILAKVLIRSNVDPKNCVYIDGNKNICDFWKASSVNYDKILVDILKNNMNLEMIAIDEYNDVFSKTGDENLKDILTRILKDEKSHMDYFTALLEALKN